MNTVVTKSAEETKRLAWLFARSLARELKPGRHATAVALSGPLGGGKTTFTQGFAEGLGVKEKVKSPTFILMQRFALRSKKFSHFYHLDCYRFKNAKEVRAIGLPEVLADSHNLVLIEWAEKIKGALPKRRITVKFSHIHERARKITFN